MTDDSRDLLLEEFHSAGIWLEGEKRPTEDEKRGRAGSGFAFQQAEIEQREFMARLGAMALRASSDARRTDGLVMVTPEFIEDLRRRSR